MTQLSSRAGTCRTSTTVAVVACRTVRQYRDSKRSNATRSSKALLPDVPTLAEQGVKGAEVQSWQAVAAPKGLPADIKLKLHGAIVAGLNEPAVKDKLVAQGVLPALARRGRTATGAHIEPPLP